MPSDSTIIRWTILTLCNVCILYFDILITLWELELHKIPSGRHLEIWDEQK
jgi:hypothetical protein